MAPFADSRCQQSDPSSAACCEASSTRASCCQASNTRASCCKVCRMEHCEGMLVIHFFFFWSFSHSGLQPLPKPPAAKSVLQSSSNVGAPSMVYAFSLTQLVSHKVLPRPTPQALQPRTDLPLALNASSSRTYQCERIAAVC